MAVSNREASIRHTLVYEGGYSNHPSDPGGPTRYGITIHDARKYWKADATAEDVKVLPLSVAVDIYRTKYWNKMHCDADPAGVDFATFDYGVNSGIGRAVPIRAKTKRADPADWVRAICSERMSFLKRLRTWPVFRGGWTRRVVDVEAKGVRMALAATQEPAEVRERLEDHSKDAGKQRNKEVTKGAGGAATGGSQAPDAPTQAAPVPDGFDWYTLLYIGCGALLTAAIVYFVYRAYQEHLRKKAYAAEAKAVADASTRQG